MMREVRNIEAHMQPVIIELYLRFLRDSANPDEREYAEPTDEIAANLVHKNYMSAADIEFCRTAKIDTLANQPAFAGAELLHQTLATLYPSESEPAETA